MINKNSRKAWKIFVPFMVLFVWVGAQICSAKPRISLGIDHLAETNFAILKGKRVGLLTHPAGVNRTGVSTIDVLRASPDVKLVALFGPEHGIYGDEKAAVPVDDKIDTRTGLPVFSLYGKFRKPTAAMLAKIDALVIDLQDVGVRCYTYVSCMRYAMEACFEKDIEVIVLDRPNPLGGEIVDGPIIEEKWMSYVGAFPVPFVHGLTIGELALFSKTTPDILKVSDSVRRKGRLTIVPMLGWKRSMTWPTTGLKWLPTSPNIPSLDSVAGYPMTGLGGQLGLFRHGIGTPHPFRFLTFEGKSAVEIKASLERKMIPGVSFRVKKATNAKGKIVEGVFVVIDDWNRFQPTALAFHMMQLTCEWQTPQPFLSASEAEGVLYNKHVGSTSWWKEITTLGNRARVNEFLESWALSAKRFRKDSRRYWLYPN
ncbi:MAG: hypothetical protein CMI31_13400 [Opitutae bacterium]|nr:hypothetical protein [Opitutae bacterium]|tara:strand:- start:2041 stop:3321 length:1281 start_codon:yes stop_codon:yes gene_type:complete